MKLLLSSGGITNDKHPRCARPHAGKADLQSRALYIPTAQWGQPACSPQSVWRSTVDASPHRVGMTGLGWESVGVLELTALPSIGAERWQPWVQRGGRPPRRRRRGGVPAHWMKESGLVRALPELDDTVWVGVSAGSM